MEEEESMNDAYITVWIDFRNLEPLDVGEEVVCKVHRTEPFHYELSVPIGWIIEFHGDQVTVKRP